MKGDPTEAKILRPKKIYGRKTRHEKDINNTHVFKKTNRCKVNIKKNTPTSHRCAS